MPPRWLVLEVEAPVEEDLRALVVEELLALPTRGVEERPGLLIAYFPGVEESSPDQVVNQVRERIRQATGVEAPILHHRWQDHEEWGESWRRGLRVRRITDRLVVSPSWEDPDPAPGELVIVLDPGMAFGTAEHPTTRGCLRLLDRTVAPGERVADIGAGSGILSIAAALLGADRVVALEMDPWALAAARENVVTNGVEDRVQVVEGEVDAGFLPEEPPFDGIVSNIEAGVLTRLLAGFRTGLRPGGWLILSGIMAHEVPQIVDEATRAGFALRDEDREGDWWSGLLEG